MRISHGYLLLAVMLFLQIFSLLGVYATSHLKRDFKLLSGHREKIIRSANIPIILNTIERRIIKEKIHCVIAPIPMTEMMKKSG